MNQFSYHRFLLQEEADDRVLRPSAPSFTSTSPFDSSLVLTVLVLLTVLFFMAFFSLYIRRFSNNNNNITNSDNSVQNEKRGGIDISTVQSLPDVLYGAESADTDSDMPTNIFSECPICLTEFEEREKVKVIPYCGHGFHPMCIETWLSSHGSCPLCRSTRLFRAVDEDRTGTG